MTTYDYILLGLAIAALWCIRADRKRDRDQIARLRARLYRGNLI